VKIPTVEVDVSVDHFCKYVVLSNTTYCIFFLVPFLSFLAFGQVLNLSNGQVKPKKKSLGPNASFIPLSRRAATAGIRYTLHLGGPSPPKKKITVGSPPRKSQPRQCAALLGGRAGWGCARTSLSEFGWDLPDATHSLTHSHTYRMYHERVLLAALLVVVFCTVVSSALSRGGSRRARGTVGKRPGQA
jgi:hypothetical protein